MEKRDGGEKGKRNDYRYMGKFVEDPPQARKKKQEKSKEGRKMNSRRGKTGFQNHPLSIIREAWTECNKQKNGYHTRPREKSS